MNKQQELVNRWDNFLSKIKQRFQESLQQGEQAVMESLDENGYDYYVSVGTLHAIKSQVYESLIKKVDETWRSQVEPAMRQEGDYWTTESRKGYDLNEQLNNELEHWQFVTEGKLSKKYYDYAIQLVNKNFYCTQCNAPVAIKANFFKAQYVACPSCTSVNTFEPETKYAHIGGNVVDNVAKYNSYNEYMQMKKAGRNYEDTAHYKNLYKIYLQKYFTERIKLLPETADSYEQDIAFEMKKNFNE